MTESSFVFGLVLDQRGGATAVDQLYPQAHGPLWLHTDYSADDARSRLLALGLDRAVVENLTRLETRPRSMTLDNGVLLMLRGVNCNPGANPEDMVSIRFWIEANRLITCRQRKLLAAQDLKARLETGAGPSSIATLVIEIIARIADRIAGFVDDMEETIEELEQHENSSETLRILQHRISELRRRTAVVRRYLAPQREALEALSRYRGNLFSEAEILSIRDQTDRINRYVEDLDLVRERCILVQEEIYNELSQQQNARMYVLSIIAAIFLPITFVTGVFGMNVGGLPGTTETTAFWAVLAVMLVVSAGTIIWLRLRKWL